MSVSVKYIVPALTAAGIGVTSRALGNNTLASAGVAGAAMLSYLQLNDMLYQSGRVKYRTAAMVGPIPLDNITYEEVAYSDKELKYRATGHTFLAHQVGDSMDVAITIKGYLFGPMRYLIMSALEELHKFGRGTEVGNRSMLVNANGVLTIMKTDTKIEAKEDVTHRSHKVMPLILPETMFLNAYIETLNFNRRVEHGIDQALEYTILLRLYDPPPKGCADNSGLAKLTNRRLNFSILNRIMNYSWRIGNFIYEAGTKRFADITPVVHDFDDLHEVEVSFTEAEENA